LRILILTVAVGVLFPRDAFAYLDPGTGSMILQVIIGAIAAALVSIKLAWRRIVDVVGSVFGRKPEPNAEAERKE
jgi:hypothetical protein